MNELIKGFNENSISVIETTINFLFTAVIAQKKYLEQARLINSSEALNRVKHLSFHGWIDMFGTKKIKQDGVPTIQIPCLEQINKYKKLSVENSEFAPILINHIAVCIKNVVDVAATGSDENTRRVRSLITEMASYDLDSSKLAAKDKDTLFDLQIRIKELYHAAANSTFAKFIIAYEKLDIYAL
ncbi:MAG: hypothetical protein QRY74_05485 [Chlamydia sp.]